MAKYKCLTHNVALIIEGNKRTFQNPPGSYAGMPKCQLHLMAKPTEGTHGECKIEKVE